MKPSNLPFSLVLLSSLLPMAGSFFNVSVYHIPAGLVLVAIASTYISAQNSFYLYKISMTWAIFLLFILLMTQIFTGRGFVILASGGYVLIFAYVFYGLFLTGAGLSVKTIVRGISFIYKFFIVGMIIEFFIIILGKQQFLGKLFAGSATPGYKTYNGADVAHFFGYFSEPGGLNSILLGSQIAGMLSLFAAIWFIGIRKNGISESVKGNSILWFILSLFMLIVTINGTVFLLLFLAIVIYFLLMNKKYRFFFLCIIISVLVGLYFLVVAGYLFPRIFSDNIIKLDPVTTTLLSNSGRLSEIEGMALWDYYVFEFTNPVDIFLSSGWVNILIGVGARYFRTTGDYLSGDFGFGYAMLAAGLTWMATLVITLFITCFPALMMGTSGSNDRKLWSVLGSVNGLIALLWLFSTIHYSQAFVNPGGVMLFALHLALTVYCRKRYEYVTCIEACS